MATKEAYVDQVKTLQRSDPNAKEVWSTYCDTLLGGIKDPNRHDAAVLAGFISAYSSGALSASRAARPSPQPAAAPSWPYGAAPAAAAWPSTPAWPRAAAGPAGPGAAFGKPAEGKDDRRARLADFVKVGQRHSPQFWKVAWTTHCGLYGNGFTDPAKYEESFVTAFIDYVGQLAAADLANTAAENGVALDETGAAAGAGEKRTMAAPEMPAAKRPALGTSVSYLAGAGGDSEKAELVDKVKALQRSNNDAKVGWQSYCDQHGQGVKDPSRHEAASLQAFLANFQ